MRVGEWLKARKWYRAPVTVETARTIALLLSSGEPAALVSSDGDKTVLEVPKAFPHGSTVSAQVAGSEYNVEVKVFRCQRAGAAYRVEGRIKNASRALKTAILERLQGESATGVQGAPSAAEMDKPA